MAVMTPTHSRELYTAVFFIGVNRISQVNHIGESATGVLFVASLSARQACALVAAAA
jgi:hypothetical protein